MRLLPLFLFALLFGCQSETATTGSDAAADARPNFLFIAVDDLRPELGAYGSEIAVTPNLDALAGRGLLFNRAYCQQAICGPSRASLMTGTRPETNGVTENYAYFRETSPDILTLPQYLRQHGYETVYSGKIFHGRFTDEELSWSRKPTKPEVPAPNNPGGYALKENQELYERNQAEMREKYGSNTYGLGLGPAYEMADVPDQAYPDGYHTDQAIATLGDLVGEGQKPFFLGLGFHHPHLNWTTPKKYWDLYDREDIRAAAVADAPEGGAAMGLHASFELRVRDGIPDSGPIDEELAITLKHAYLASVSYVDAQIGRMMEALEASGELNNTVVVVWGDHGWHLGDLGIWGKATNYEIATRVPLMIHTPTMPEASRGAKTDALVELVDLFPTLVELAGLEQPEQLEGQSFVPLLADPNREWKPAAFSQYPNPALREWAANPLSEGMRETYFGPLIEEVEDRIIEQQGEKWDRDLFENHLMGYTIRTDRYRLVAWKDRRQPDAEPLYVELYDHQEDPDETRNVAEARPELTTTLLRQLDRGWQGNMAPDNPSPRTK
ncbi:iduronate 2-sulfatase [Lewinella marina]|uniref:Iduronate-2-sulfatase n=1 Tax=Neolewinella marina TaxID=438751 RepID=A0A2G0CDL7_9BACT|nr:sulfatase [Neolewinella marina]NJB85953.1 iduronate 2-sulfatase [Neolewinella marina]PHK98076.1 iduronate-2-sulfatase [Neolewinella marina]